MECLLLKGRRMHIFNVILSESPQFLKGILIAIELAAGLLTFGFILGMVIAILEVFGNKIISKITIFIRKVLWGIPQMILLLLVFYLPFDLDPMIAAIIALGLCSSAFQSQIFRGAILSVDPGQIEAAKAMGLTSWKILLYIITPQMIRLSIGPWTNEFSSEIKDTSLAYVVGLVEIMRQARYIITYTYGNSLTVFFFVGMIYFVLTKIGNTIFFKIEDLLWVPGFEKRRE